MKRILTLFILTSVWLFPAAAQEIELTITEINTQPLSLAAQQYFEKESFLTKLQDYVNQHRWTQVEFMGDRIPVQMSLFITSGSESGEFTAQVVIASQRRKYEDGRPTKQSNILLRLSDTRWSFTYVKTQPFVHDEYQFNDLTSLIDFYMYLIIAADFDSMELLQGTPYYQKALNIAQRSQGSGRSAEWQGSSNQYSRMNIIAEFLNPQYVDLRTLFYWYYYEGIDFMATEPEIAKESIGKALDLLLGVLSTQTSRSFLITMWLEINYQEFCNYLQGFSRRTEIMKALSQADPPRADVYQRCSF